MPQDKPYIIEVPGIGVVEFPAGTPPEDINRAINRALGNRTADDQPVHMRGGGRGTQAKNLSTPEQQQALLNALPTIGGGAAAIATGGASVPLQMVAAALGSAGGSIIRSAFEGDDIPTAAGRATGEGVLSGALQSLPGVGNLIRGLARRGAATVMGSTGEAADAVLGQRLLRFGPTAGARTAERRIAGLTSDAERVGAGAPVSIKPNNPAVRQQWTDFEEQLLPQSQRGRARAVVTEAYDNPSLMAGMDAGRAVRMANAARTRPDVLGSVTPEARMTRAMATNMRQQAAQASPAAAESIAGIERIAPAAETLARAKKLPEVTGPTSVRDIGQMAQGRIPEGFISRGIKRVGGPIAQAAYDASGPLMMPNAIRAAILTLLAGGGK